jgi:hypothetical protein
MPTVTSKTKEKFDREFMEKQRGNKPAEEKDKHEHLRSSGFKELSKGYEFAKSHELEDKTKHHFNVKYAGSPEKYHVRRSFSVPGMTGASEKMGEYETPQEVTGAVDKYMATKK